MSVTASPVDLTVITATYQRPESLQWLLAQVQQQERRGLQIEHLVISDGPDAVTRAVVQGTAASYHELPQWQGNFGAACKDFGLQWARGKYVCFWDDDNLYEPHALRTLWQAAQGVEIGVVRTRHWLTARKKFVLLPRRWQGVFRPGDIDTMCVCMHTELARKAHWHAAPQGRGTDHRWLNRLMSFQPTLRYLPICIGAHLTFGHSPPITRLPK